MLHTSCGAHDHHDRYAPSTIPGLTSKGYDYWALGHIHKFQRLAGPPAIIYSGNPQGRHIGETGAKSCTIVTCDGDHLRNRQHSVDVLRWFHVKTDVEGCEDTDAVVQTVVEATQQQLAQADHLPIAIRIELSGPSEAHRQFVKQTDYWDEHFRHLILDHFDERVWVEKIKFRTHSRTPLRETDSAFGELIESLGNEELAQSALCHLQADFERLTNEIPTDPRVVADEIDLEHAGTLAAVVSEAREMLIGRLLDLGGDQ